jgi:hypothetical protein
MLLTLFGRLAIVGIALVAVFYLWGDRILERAAPDQAPEPISFHDALLDGEALARRRAYVSISGVYRGIAEDHELLYPTNDNSPGGSDWIGLRSSGAPRPVRDFLQECRKRDGLSNATAVCPLRITGHYTDCHLNIFGNPMDFPCIRIESVERTDQ